MSKDLHTAPSSTRLAGWRQDLFASVVVFLVALPLCMGIAIASGMPPELGLVTGIIGGIVVGALQGAPLQVSGPAAGLSVLLWELIQRHGIATVGIIVGVAGVLQLVAGLTKLGRWFRAVPPSVIHGMLSGIGVLIVSSQLHVMMDDKPHPSGLQNILTIPALVWKTIVHRKDLPHETAALLGIATILILFLWNRYLHKRFGLIPGALVVIVLASLLAHLLHLPIAYVNVPETLRSSVVFPTWSGVQKMITTPSLWGSALAIAFIASAATLLCATAVDQMHKGPRTNYNRELFAQGVGNILCGILGALPIAGVIVRSTANIQAGGQSRLSAVFHGVWLLLLVLFFPTWLRWIPVSSLGALLVYTGYKLLDPTAFKQLAKHARSEVVICLLTIAAIVATDLLQGVFVGILLSIGKLLYRLSKIRIHVEKDPLQKRATLYLEGAATFLRLPEIAEMLESIPPGFHVSFRFDKLEHLDHAIVELLRAWEKQHRTQGGEVSVDWDFLTHRYQTLETQSPKT